MGNFGGSISDIWVHINFGVQDVSMAPDNKGKNISISDSFLIFYSIYCGIY